MFQTFDLRSSLYSRHVLRLFHGTLQHDADQRPSADELCGLIQSYKTAARSERSAAERAFDADRCVQRRRDQARASKCGDEAGDDDGDGGGGGGAGDTLVAFGLTPVGLTLDVSLQLRQWLMDALDLADCHCYHDFVAARCELEDYDVDDALDGDRADEAQVATGFANFMFVGYFPGEGLDPGFSFSGRPSALTAP